MNKIKLALFVFVLVSLLDILGIIFSIPILIQIFKPFILLSLMVLYFVSVSKLKKIYLYALIFSFFGDVLLMFEGALFFIFGLISFLIAHLFFIKIVIQRLQKSTFSAIIFSVIPFLILFLCLILFLKNYLNELLIPVIIYGFTISIFGVVSLLDFINSKSKKSLFMLIGAVFFISSDSILAINKFYHSTVFFNVIIMMTYIVAQYLIYKSEVEKENGALQNKKLKSLI